MRRGISWEFKTRVWRCIGTLLWFQGVCYYSATFGPPAEAITDFMAFQSKIYIFQHLWLQPWDDLSVSITSKGSYTARHTQMFTVFVLCVLKTLSVSAGLCTATTCSFSWKFPNKFLKTGQKRVKRVTTYSIRLNTLWREVKWMF